LVSSAPTFFNKSPTIDRADMRDEDEVLEPVELLCVSLGLINCDDVDVGETI